MTPRRIIRLTTTGKNSGNPHTVDVTLFTASEREFMIGGAGASPEDPDWSKNLRIHPGASIVDRDKPRSVVAQEAHGNLYTSL